MSARKRGSFLPLFMAFPPHALEVRAAQPAPGTAGAAPREPPRPSPVQPRPDFKFSHATHFAGMTYPALSQGGLSSGAACSLTKGGLSPFQYNANGTRKLMPEALQGLKLFNQLPGCYGTLAAITARNQGVILKVLPVSPRGGSSCIAPVHSLTLAIRILSRVSSGSDFKPE